MKSNKSESLPKEHRYEEEKQIDHLVEANGVLKERGILWLLICG